MNQFSKEAVTKNLKHLLSGFDITGREFARRSGLTQATVQRMLSGAIADYSASSIFMICKAFDLSSDEIIGLSALSPKFFPENTVINGNEQYLPVIPFEEAGNWNKKIQDVYPDKWRKWYLTDAKASDKAFAVIVESDNTPLIPEDAILVIDPEFKMEHGINVLVYTKGYSVSIRKVIVDAPDTYLQSLNAQLQPSILNENQVIIGKIVQIKVNHEG